MKRTIAVVTFLLAFAALVKLAIKPIVQDDRTHPTFIAATSGPSVLASDQSGAAAQTELTAKYSRAPREIRELVARVVERYGRTALAIDHSDGERGLMLLDRMDLEAIFLYEKHPDEFRKLAGLMGADAAADVLWHWRMYFGLKRADDADRSALISEIARLGPAQLRAAARYPSALPLILAEPREMTELVGQMSRDEKMLADALAVLCFIDLENGPAAVRSALLTLKQHGRLALDAFRRFGLEGFALVTVYGPILESLGDALPLDESLVVLRVNAEFIDELLKTHHAETVAGHLRHAAAVGLTELVGGSPDALRLVVEYGAVGERALRRAGADAAEVVFGDFGEPALRRQAVAALAEHGVMALAMLEKYASDPDFQDILRAHAGAVIRPIAQADGGPETLAYLQSKTRRSFTEAIAATVLFSSGDNGPAVIRAIKNDGLERVAEQNQTGVRFYQFLPMYDLIHLGNVMRRGYAPTASEMTWAMVDGSFVIADVLSLAAAQPEGVLAAESIRAEVKAAAREGIKAAGREAVTAGSESGAKSLARHQAVVGLDQTAASGSALAARRLARWWRVRAAGGFFEVLRQTPEALARLDVATITEIARPICTKAGLRLSQWRPVRLLQNGAEIVSRIPPQRGLKYVAAQAIQASVGVIAFQKMEEHIASRRPRRS
jgi:hypothetical protein